VNFWSAGQAAIERAHPEGARPQERKGARPQELSRELLANCCLEPKKSTVKNNMLAVNCQNTPQWP
jgi:hypothetical protein